MKQLFPTFVTIFEFLISQELRLWLRLALKPLAVLATLALFLWVGAWFDTQIAARVAHAESTEIQALACPVGLEQSGALCYPPCQEGFYGDGPICVKRCPAGYTDDIAFCRKDAHIFAKASYGRGGGTGLVCAANQEAQGGLCYPRCIPSHYGVGPVCWQRCPGGYADHGATCYRGIFDWFFKNTYGRGAGGPVTVCPAGLERNGALCYPRCAAGFVGNGPVCFQQCPAGYKDDGALCRKDAIIFAKETYGRGAGVVMNTVPEALDATFRTAKNTPVTLTFEHNDFDDDQALPTTIVQQPSHGRYDGERYIPNPEFEGEDRLLWKVNDGKNDSNVAVHTILVGNVGANSAPVALDRTVTVTEDTPLMIDVTCTDADNDELLYQLLIPPQHGEYEWLPPNTVIYTPTVDFVGTDTFTFRSHDGQEFSNVSTITLAVTAVNDAPIVLTGPISTTRNSNAAITLAATDVESDTISYTLVSSPTHGLLTGTIPDLLYTPVRNFVGADSFQFAATDAGGAATPATVSITVLPTNTTPVADNLVLTTTQESVLAVILTATDTDGDDLTYTVVSSPTHGTLTGAGTDWIYTPVADFIGVDSLTVQVNDGQAASAPATVTINVVAAPQAASVGGLVFEDRNGNGQPDADEVGVRGVLVTLTPASGRIGANFSAVTEPGGGWRIDNAPFGQYTLRIDSTSSMQLAAPVETSITLDSRGLRQIQPAAVTVRSRALFLPLIER
jgi:hypothetical protein